MCDLLTCRDWYSFAERRSVKDGWQLNLELTGHRISDYAHEAHFAGAMSSVDIVPATDLWVVEVGLVHPSDRFVAS